MDTIFAVSSGAPPTAIAILRISGPEALPAARSLAGTLPPPRRAGLRALRSGGGGLLDRALVLVFPGPDSATGEDLVELHLHGGRAIVAAVGVALASLGLRSAEAGEFTRRALINGRIDLAEAEGLGDLLAAQTEGQRVAALSAAEGLVSTRVNEWLDRIAGLSARIEAELDFSDEDDVAAGETTHELINAIAALADEMAQILAEPPVERLHDGLRVVLAGPPNSGKSTLFNRLVQRDAAIVSPISGTTRDLIEAPIVRDGIAYILIDTAGLAEQTSDSIETIGIERANHAIARADILLWLGDDPPAKAGALWIHARADVSGRSTVPDACAASVSRDDDASIRNVWKLVSAQATTLLPRDDMLALNSRQRHCVAAAQLALTEYDGADLLIVAEHLRLARVMLAELLGHNATEIMLDALFSRFCIGK